MKTVLLKIAAVLAFIIGAMAIFAGGQVLLGKVPDYYVIDWLPVYNFTLGLLSALVTAILIWKNSRFAVPAALATFSLHAVVMLVLQTVYANVVALDSLVAMMVRLVVWLIIVALLVAHNRKTRVSEKRDEMVQ